MTTRDLPTVYIGDKFTIGGREVVVGERIGVQPLGNGHAGVVVTLYSDDVHIDPSAMAPGTRIVGADELYPTGRVDETIGYLKATRAHIHAHHVDMYGAHADHVPNETIDVIDEALARLGVPVVDTTEVRTWGATTPSRVDTEETTEYPADRLTYADEAVLCLDGVSFVTGGNEVEWVGADVIDGLEVKVVSTYLCVWPIDNPDHLGEPLERRKLFTVATLTWDEVYGGGAYVVPCREVRVDKVRLDEGVTDDRMSRAEYEVAMSHDTVYNDVDTLLTRAEYEEARGHDE